MASGVLTRLWHRVAPLWFRPLPPVPQGRQTALQPFVPASPASSPPPSPPHGLSADDMALIESLWHAHLKNYPDLTWPRFLEILSFRERFFAEERADREARLAALQDPRR